MKPKIVVIGAGANGLSSALLFMQKYPYSDVVIVSEKNSPNTTSDVAAGFWNPYFTGDTPLDKILEWSSSTWNILLDWSKKKENWGVSIRPGITISDSYTPEDIWSDIVFGYRFLPQEEYKKYGDQYQRGVEFTSIFGEPSKFLPRLATHIKHLGGDFVQDSITNLQDAAEKYNADLIINCSGLGSRFIVPDPTVYPIRGQIFKVKAPWQKTFFVDESDSSFTYILPNQDVCVLGGTHTENDWNLEIDENDSRDIWNRVCSFVPEFSDAPIVNQYAGLRPGRKPGIRVEADDVATTKKSVPVVHNYGHGGAGITLFWGSSDEATDIAVKVISKYHPPLAKL